MFVTVAAGGTDTAAWSTDGLTWVQATLPKVANWTVVSYGGGYFFAIAASSLHSASSVDGKVWQYHTTPVAGAWKRAVYGAGRMVTTTDGQVIALTTM